MNRYVEQSVARILLGFLLLGLAGCEGLSSRQETIAERPLVEREDQDRRLARLPDLRPRSASRLVIAGRVFINVEVENRGTAIAPAPFQFETIVVINGQRQTFTNTVTRSVGMGQVWGERIPITVPAMPRPLPIAVDVTVDSGAPRGRVFEQDERNNSAHYNLTLF